MAEENIYDEIEIEVSLSSPTIIFTPPSLNSPPPHESLASHTFHTPPSLPQLTTHRT